MTSCSETWPLCAVPSVMFVVTQRRASCARVVGQSAGRSAKRNRSIPSDRLASIALPVRWAEPETTTMLCVSEDGGWIVKRSGSSVTASGVPLMCIIAPVSARSVPISCSVPGPDVRWTSNPVLSGPESKVPWPLTAASNPLSAPSAGTARETAAGLSPVKSKARDSLSEPAGSAAAPLILACAPASWMVALAVAVSPLSDDRARSTSTPSALQV